MPVTTAPIATACEACGQEIPPGAYRCPACGQTVGSRSSRLTLFVVVVLILASFASTQYFVKLHRNTENFLAERWFARGNAAMHHGNPAAAAEDYRNALSYDRENNHYRLRLAQALLASNHLNEARSHLLSLWNDEPASGEVNLALARLYAGANDRAQAVHYYRNAINGVWSDAPQPHRIAARLALVQYLLQRHDMGQASAELLALQADEPPGVADRLLLAHSLLQVGEAHRAVDEYNQLLKDDPRNVQAWLGLGEGLCELGDYQPAEHSLAKAVELDPVAAEGRGQLALVREVLRVAPSLRGLPRPERAHRAADAFNIAMNRLTGCAAQKGFRLDAQGGPTPSQPAGNSNHPPAAGSPSPVLQSGASAPDDLQLLFSRGLQIKSAASESALRRNPDSLDAVMQFVFQVESTTAPVCPDMSETDRALLVLDRHQSEGQR